MYLQRDKIGKFDLNLLCDLVAKKYSQKEFTTEECLNSYLKQVLYYSEAGYTQRSINFTTDALKCKTILLWKDGSSFQKT